LWILQLNAPSSSPSFLFQLAYYYSSLHLSIIFSLFHCVSTIWSVKRRCFVCFCDWFHGVCFTVSLCVVILAMIELIRRLVVDSGFGFVNCFAQFIRNVWLERRRGE
jgi:uncharacterized membrane protein YhdT